MSKKIAILQSNYIPWKGYFDLLASVDELILFDDMQYTRRDWRNRNLVKTPHGAAWLTVPVIVKGRYHQRIRDTEIDGTAWARSHLDTLDHNYRRAAHFEEIRDWIAPLYLGRTYSHLSDLNRKLIEAVCAYLGITTRITNSWDYDIEGDRTNRLLNLCVQAGADEYVSGPAAKAYMEEDVFAAAGMKLSWFDYTGYPEYPQLWGDFDHAVSIVDLLFNCGRDAPRFMRHVHP